MIRKRKQNQLKREKFMGCVANNPTKLKNGETERKRAEEALKGSSVRLAAVMDSIDALVYVADFNSYEVLFLNKYGREVWGDIVGQRCWETIQKSQRGPCKFCTNYKLLSDSGIPTGVYRWEFQNTVNGRWYDCRDQAIHWIDGRLVRMEIATDITKRKRSEEELKQLKHQYELILQSAGEGIACLDLEGKITFANPFAVKTTGYEIEELIGQNLHKLLHYKKPDGTQYPYEECPSYETLKTGVLKNIRDEVFFRKDGTSFPVRYTSTPIIEDNEIKGAVVTFRDITERKRIEEELKQLKHQHELILQSAGEGILVLDLEGKQKFVNPIAAKMLGYEIEELIGQSSHTICHHSKIDGSPYPEKECPIYAAYTDGVIHTRDDEVFWRKDGTSFPVRYTCTPIWENDKLTGAVVIFIDITERKQAEKEIDRLASFPLTSPSPVLEVDSSGTVIFSNIAAIKTLKRLGVKENLCLFFPRDINEILKALEQKKDEEFYREIIIGDATFEEYIQIVPQYNCIRIRSTDISERKKLESQLLQAQKMEAVGQLTGGIAHDFNNILTAIIGYSSLLQMKMSMDNPLRHNVDQILASTERAANLTQSLLAFSRKQIMSLQSVMINEIVKRVEKLLLRIIGADIEIKTILTDEDLTVMADSGQIEQVLMNLATNARDAMPDGGSLTVETEIVELDEKYIETHGYGEPGMYALISVTDTGEGMNEETKQKIFDPFFTNKEVGKGTGLGLSMAYGIIKQHNGYINVYSEVGKGTTFKIYLPLIKAEIKETKLTEPPPTIGGTETILLAEDDADVKTFTKAVLEEFGYTVIEAVDGRDAINKFMENKDKIELLMLDVIMPMKSGKGVYEEIKKIRADIKTIFMSGYTADSLDQQGIIEKELDFILKPVSPTNLLRKIREVLAKQ